MEIPDDEAPEDILRNLKRKEAELQAQLDDLEAEHRRRAIRNNIGWGIGGFIAGLLGRPQPKQPPLDQ